MMDDSTEPKKLIIQIPCYEEAEALPIVLRELPRHVDGFDVTEWMVVDDGSTDATSDVARRHGVDHVVRLPVHQGLARAFMVGLEESLAAGAAVIVNTDADNQYRAEDIPALVAPILQGSAQIVVGARPIERIEEFSPAKRWLQRFGSRLVRLVSGTEVADATSGFRAIAREAGERLHVFAEYTYTLEMIIQAGRQGIPVATVPIGTNPSTRPSRLMRSTPRYVLLQVLTIFRILMIYRPLRFFSIPAAVLVAFGLLLDARFLYFWLSDGGAGHVQSLVLAAIATLSGVSLFVVALVADLVGTNRRLLEQIDSRVRRLERARHRAGGGGAGLSRGTDSSPGTVGR